MIALVAVMLAAVSPVAPPVAPPAEPEAPPPDDKQFLVRPYFGVNQLLLDLSRGMQVAFFAGMRF